MQRTIRCTIRCRPLTSKPCNEIRIRPFARIATHLPMLRGVRVRSPSPDWKARATALTRTPGRRHIIRASRPTPEGCRCPLRCAAPSLTCVASPGRPGRTATCSPPSPPPATRPRSPRSVRRHGPLVRGACRRQLGDSRRRRRRLPGDLPAARAQRRPPRLGPTVGPWLYAAARRVASNARVAAARRRRAESHAARRATARRPPTRPCAEVWRSLDDELAALPARLRGPLVLCYLEGRTRDEAAGQLGVSVSTLKRLLARGRLLLQAAGAPGHRPILGRPRRAGRRRGGDGLASRGRRGARRRRNRSPGRRGTAAVRRAPAGDEADRDGRRCRAVGVGLTRQAGGTPLPEPQPAAPAPAPQVARDVNGDPLPPARSPASAARHCAGGVVCLFARRNAGRPHCCSVRQQRGDRLGHGAWTAGREVARPRTADVPAPR